MKTPTAVELLLAAAFAAAVAFLVVPDFLRARDGYRIEMAARAAAACDRAVAAIAKAREKARADDPDAAPTNAVPTTLADVHAALEDLGEPPLVWPEAADISTLDLDSTNGVSVVVLLGTGPRRVDAHDLETDHVN